MSRKALGEFYDRYGTRIYRYCVRLLGDQPLAEDVVQETFLRFHQSAQKARVMTNVEAFLFRIARNLALNVRRSKHFSTLPISDLEMTLHDQPYENRELENLIVMALDSLPDALKEVIVLREYNGMSYNEIAESIGVSIDVVSVRIHRAKKKLQQILAPYLDDQE